MSSVAVAVVVAVVIAVVGHGGTLVVMTNGVTLLLDAYQRIAEEVRAVVSGLDSATLEARLDPAGNSIAWLVWHLTRVQDDHIAAAAGLQQVWTKQGWADRFDLPFDVAAHGYGQSSVEVGQVRGVSAGDLVGYHAAVHAQTVAHLHTITDDDLDRIVDDSWDPPVTLGVRLVSVIADDLQHVGQAAFLRGTLERSRG